MINTTWRSLGAAIGRILLGLALTTTVSAVAQNAPPAAGQQLAKPALSGKVTDKAGKPVANATVQLAGPDFQQAKTDAQGNYTFRIGKGGEYRIGVEASGFLTIEYWNYRNSAMQLSPQAQGTRDIVLERGASIVVTVTDSAGEPVKGARVDANIPSSEYRGGGRPTMTDDSGTATITVMPSKKEYTVCAVHNSFAPAHAAVTVESIDDPADVALAMEAGQTVKGMAICNDGKPASGWEIYATPDWWVSPYLPEMAKIDAKGNFTMRNLGPGTYKLKLHMRMGNNGGGTIQDLPITFEVPVAQQPMRVDLPVASPVPGTKVTGKVRVTGGRPDYVQVNANSLSGPRQWLNAQVDFSGAGPKTGKDAVVEGRYTFDGIPAGTYQLSFQSPNTEMKTLEQVKVPGEIPLVELKMVGRPHLAGAVVDAASGKPVTEFSIRSRKLQHLGTSPAYGEEQRWTQVSSPEGKFDLQMQSPGVYQAQVMAPGYAITLSSEARLENGEAKTDLAVKLTTGGALSGIVADPSGKPVAGAKVIPYSIAGSPELRGMDRFMNEMGAVTTDAAGRFVLEHLAAGEEKLKVIHPGFARKVFGKLKVAEGQNSDIGPLALTAGGRVEGIVYDGNGKPVAELAMQFRDSEGQYPNEDENAGRLAMVTTDEDGKFRAEHLPEVPVYVTLTNGWNREGMIRRIIRPTEGKTTHVDFGGTNPVKGRLIGAKGPVANTRIQLGGPSPHFHPAMIYGKTDAAGRFTFHGVPAGRYTVHYMTDLNNYEWTSVKEVEITPQTVDLGDLKAEGSDVVITAQADDPADLQTVQQVYLRLADQDMATIRAVPEGDQPGRWRAKSVAPGKYRVQAASQSAGASYSALVECGTSNAEAAVTLRMPKASATLSLTMPRSADTPLYGVQVAMLANEDQSVMTYISSQAEQPRIIKLPPGTYRVLDYATWQVREDIAPITLKEGEEKSVEITLVTPERAAVRPVTVAVWSAQGVLMPDARPRILDAAGKVVPEPRMRYTQTSYALQPGHYRAVLDRAGAEALAKEFDVAAGGGTVNVDLFVP